MSIHYDRHDAVTKMQGKISLLMEMGGRGVGKTHTHAVGLATNERSRTIWIRRKTDELRRATSTFTKYLERDEKVRDDQIGYIGQKIIETNELGKQISVDAYYTPEQEEKVCFLPLSTAHKLKSTEMGIYNWGVYDEFTSLTGDYLKDEEIQFIEMMSTQMRLRNFRCVLIGNNCDPFNPIFNFFNIHPEYDKEYQGIYNERGVKIGLLHMINASPEFVDEYKKSTIGLWTDGSHYNDYALNNKAFWGTQIPVAKNEPKMIQEFHLRYKDIYKGEKYYHVTEKGDATMPAYTNDIRQVSIAEKVSYSDDIMFILRPIIKQGWVVAENELVLSRLYDWLGVI